MLWAHLRTDLMRQLSQNPKHMYMYIFGNKKSHQWNIRVALYYLWVCSYLLPISLKENGYKKGDNFCLIFFVFLYTLSLWPTLKEQIPIDGKQNHFWQNCPHCMCIRSPSSTIVCMKHRFLIQMLIQVLNKKKAARYNLPPRTNQCTLNLSFAMHINNTALQLLLPIHGSLFLKVKDDRIHRPSSVKGNQPLHLGQAHTSLSRSLSICCLSLLWSHPWLLLLPTYS